MPINKETQPIYIGGVDKYLYWYKFLIFCIFYEWINILFILLTVLRCTITKYVKKIEKNWFKRNVPFIHFNGWKNTSIMQILDFKTFKLL